MNEEQIERIELYLNGELSLEQKSLFEKELQANEELQKQVQFMRNLPKAVQISAENAIRKQLKELEGNLPKVKLETQGSGEAAKVIPMPQPASGTRWMQYAIAASVLLLMGLFIFKDQLFTTNTGNQLAENDKLADTLKTLIDVGLRNNTSLSTPDRRFHLKHKTNQLAVSSLDVTSVIDDKFGFVKNSLEKKITLVIKVDSALFNQGIKYGLYNFQRDSLFVRTASLETKIKIYYFDIKSQSGQMIDSTSGELLEYEKPPLKGLFAFGMGNFFRIESKSDYTPLVKVNTAEKELLKFYTK